VSLNIKNDETVALAEEVAKMAGLTKTGAIRAALKLMRERLTREQAAAPGRRDRLAAAAERIQALPATGEVSVDDLYDENGLWK